MYPLGWGTAPGAIDLQDPGLRNPQELQRPDMQDKHLSDIYRYHWSRSAVLGDSPEQMIPLWRRHLIIASEDIQPIAIQFTHHGLADSLGTTELDDWNNNTKQWNKHNGWKMLLFWGSRKRNTGPDFSPSSSSDDANKMASWGCPGGGRNFKGQHHHLAHEWPCLLDTDVR